MQMTPGKTQARKDPPQRVLILIMSISKNLSWYRFMCSSPTWSFIKDSKLTKTKPESCIRNAHLLEKTTTTRTTERKNLRNLFFKWKKGKRKFLHANYLKYRDNFNITTTGVGLLPTATTIRIMNGPHAFALSAFKSEQKSAKKKKNERSHEFM